jgi:hypothetical protein
MPSIKSKMNGGSSCGSINKKMTGGSKKSMKGGSSCGAVNKKMTGGKSKKSSKSKTPMKSNQAYCMVCRERVEVHDPKDIKKKTKTRTMVMRVALCPKGHKTYRIVGN